MKIFLMSIHVHVQGINVLNLLIIVLCSRVLIFSCLTSTLDSEQSEIKHRAYEESAQVDKF